MRNISLHILILLSIAILRIGFVWECGWAYVKPNIDGKIDEEIWNKAHIVATTFNSSFSPPFNLTAYFLNDNDYLYIAFRINDSDFRDVDVVLLIFDTGENPNIIKIFSENIIDSNSQNNPEQDDAWGIVRKYESYFECEVKIKLMTGDPDDLNTRPEDDKLLKIRIEYRKSPGLYSYWPRPDDYELFYLAREPKTSNEWVIIAGIAFAIVGIGVITYWFIRRYKPSPKMPLLKRKRRRRKISPA